MPGSPPSSTSDPGTTPPPSTRSNSPIPVESLGNCSTSISEYKRAVVGAPGVAYRCDVAVVPLDSAGRSSTYEFQAPQSAQRPSHFGDCEPHSWQTKKIGRA